MPTSTPDSYTDAPALTELSNDDFENDSLMDVSGTGEAQPTTRLVAFYGAGPTKNVYGNEEMRTIVSRISDSVSPLNADRPLYFDTQEYVALNDLLSTLDTNHDHIITQNEINAMTFDVLGYSWGAIAAINLTNDLSKPDAHLDGSYQFVRDFQYPKGHTVMTGGWNLQAAVPIKVLDTLDPVTNAFGVSGLIHSPKGVANNVGIFNNYYQTRGGSVDVPLYYLDIGSSYVRSDTMGNEFSSRIKGSKINTSLPANRQNQVCVTTQLANDVRDEETFISGSNGEILYAELRGSDVQHDSMPIYLFSQVLVDFGVN